MTPSTATIRGAAALHEILERMGDEDFDDHASAKILVEHQLDLRALLIFTMATIADEMR
jgi:hypothetical protein